MKNIKAVIFDIDGVLAKKSPDREHREYDKVDLDLPIQETIRILNFYISEMKNCNGIDVIVFVTGRKELCRSLTLDFFRRYTDVFDNDEFFKLFMRDDKDHRPSDILKKEIYENHIKDKYDVIAVFEDDPKNVKMFRDLGLLVFDVGRENEK